MKNLTPISTAEKLWFANKYIKLLKDEVESLKKHGFDELVYAPKEVRVNMAKQRQIIALENKNKNLKRINEGLIDELIKLKLIININKEI